ncbi:hypothetical protein [Erwinia pyrifoliae]|uniref:Uncharacterized protein n=1 Tax=Erwinia pyrifoliae TaxID=79967 RepID=A0ABY5X3L0_ERWPY|nr:hypothetical protein [Erwinia pyrifoliae]UWS30811.1 hypothetical protein NYP81_04945 [Erwinia pyrifoliae]UWS31960.1 hypothetical protein NYP84_09735 [Erwinia pyrifoliae]UXK13829.1 hypothetical protein NYP80_08520 [Erwinia pyrifoliae]
MARQIAPGYCVVERPGNLDFQARELFRDIRSPAASMFMKLNADTQWLKPGQLLIVADPDTTAPVTTQMLHKLRQAKQNTNNALIGVSTEDAGFLQKHYGMIAGLTSAGDKIFGTAGDVGEKYFSAIEQTLKKIEASYQNQYRTQGSLIGQQFYAERNQLLNQLKELVNKPLVKSLARHSVKFRPYEDMRRALNLSSRSIVHEWSTAGVTGIPGYSTYVGNAAKAARFLKYGGYIGIGFAFAGTTNDVADACTKGREGECGKVAFREYGKFGATTAIGMGAGAIGSVGGIGVCAAVGIATAGVGGLACAAVGSIAAGYAGSQAADWGMETLYNYWGI